MRSLILKCAVPAIFSLSLLLGSCNRPPTNADGSSGTENPPQGNLPPVTHLFLLPDTVGLDTSASVLEVRWWGEDPDGWVVGYFVFWDYFGESELCDSIWTTSESAVFYLPLDSAYDEFTITVKAVDNSAQWNWSPQAKVAQAVGGAGVVTAGILDYMEYELFLDIGSASGVYDIGDSLLWAGNIADIQTTPGTPLQSAEPAESGGFLAPPMGSIIDAMDQVGASLTFPVRNTAPLVEFRIESNPVLASGDTCKTFLTRSFFWEVSDLDGNETVDSCFYALDPVPGDTAWIGLPGSHTSVSLTELSPGLHRFCLKVQDIAGAFSPLISFPDTTDRFWEVIEPLGELLIVDDYNLDATNIALNLYKSIFDTLSNVAGQYSVWEVGDNLPYAASDVLANLNYFQKVFWYSFSGFSHYPEALNAISSFLSNGGTLLISASQVDTSSGVLPLSQYGVGQLRLAPPNGFDPVLPDWPPLNLGQLYSYWIYGLEASADGELLYEFSPAAQWTGYPGICVRRTDPWKLVFISAPLHMLNGAGTLPEFMHKVFFEAF
ncbi:MAG: hypothetical protein ABH878_03365 [bacterium]